MEEYIKLDQLLHQLCQVHALITSNLVKEQEDYSHTNLGFDALGRRILSRWISTNHQKVCLSLNLEKFTFEWLSDSFDLIKEIEIVGKYFGQLQNEVQSSLTEIGFVEKELTVGLKYEIQDYPFKGNSIDHPETESLDEWIRIRSLANFACNLFLKFLNSDAEVRIWPHHFDTGFYLEIANKLGVGFGLAMKDNLIGSPYFYLSGYPLSGDLQMKNLPSLENGHWEKGNWKGAVLTLRQFYFREQDKQDIIHRFLKSAFAWHRKNYISKTSE